MTHPRTAGRAGVLLIPIALLFAACSSAVGSSAPSAAPGAEPAVKIPPAGEPVPAK